MRDPRFVVLHRGGSLKNEQHKQLIQWSIDCVEHIIRLIPEQINSQLDNAFIVSKLWLADKASVGECRKASVLAHKFARETTIPILIPFARAIGHMVATAHMADHSMGGAIYSLKVVKLAGLNIIEERNWQNEYLPLSIKELVISSRIKKELGFKDLRNSII